MYKVQVTIKGLTPLRYNRFLIRGKDEPNIGKMTHEEQIQNALDRSYRDDKGQFYVPDDVLGACIINGGKKVKIGRSGASKLLEAIMIFENEKFYVGTDKYKIQQGVVRIPPKTGARILQYWVVIEKWKVDFEVTILDSVFPSNGLKESIEMAGMYYCLLDGRPKLGRFELTHYKKIKELKQEKGK